MYFKKNCFTELHYLCMILYLSCMLSSCIFFLNNILFMMSFGGLDKHTETSHIFLVEYWCVSEALDYLRIILHVLFGGIKSSDLYNTNPILPLQHNSVQYPLEDFVITASSCGLCVAQLGKSKATEVESIKIASVSCLSSLSHAFNFFPPSPILPCTGIFHLNSPPPPPPPSSDGNPFHSLLLFLLFFLLTSDPPSTLWS